MVNCKIAFHLSHFSIRGSEIAVYDYAHYNEEILKNISFIAVNSNFRDRKDYRGVSLHDEEIFKKFSSRFPIIEYTSLHNLSSSLKEKDITIFYNLKSGENDGFVVKDIKNVCHSIFTYTHSQRHGEIYIPISPAIVSKDVRDVTPYVPHIVCPLPSTTDNVRGFLQIPDDAIVFGRYGGEETFNIPFVHEAIVEIAEKNPNIYFLFVNTSLFTHPRKNIIFLQKLSDPLDKSIYINSCDAMLHGRKEGESFGLAIAEFSMARKPVITWRHNKTPDQIKKDFNMNMDVEHTHHIETLGDSGIYYSDKESLIDILQNFKRKQGDDRYTESYCPEKVMALFNDLIISPSRSRMIEKDRFEKCERVGAYQTEDFEDYSYFRFSDDNQSSDVYSIIKSLIKPSDIFLDIGANVGYDSIRISHLITDGKVIAIESCKERFDLLSYNVRSNNLKNIRYETICLQNKNDIDYILEGERNRVGLIKIDCSGDEMDLIKGSVKTIMKHRPYIIIPKLEDFSILTHLMTVLDYSRFGYLCFPNEKSPEIHEIFNTSLRKIIPKKSERDGLYPTKAFENRKFRVKLSCNWTTGEELCKYWEKMSKGYGVWNNITVVSDDKDIDYYVIINKPPPGDKYISSKTLVFRMEPDTSTGPRWNDWYKSKRDFLYFFDLDKYRNNTEWHIGLSYKQLQNDVIPKTKIISSVLSSLYEMEGHKKRIDFVKYIQSRGLDIDVYGRDNIHLLKNHRGELPYHNKNDGILPYKYTFIAENCSLKNYFTEKINDAILGECLCFYWGCPNINLFIDPKAYIILDLNNMEESYNTVVSAIKNDEWMKRLPYIMKEKEKILEHYSFFPRLDGYIQMSNIDCKVINLDRRRDRWSEFVKMADERDFFRYTRFSAVDGKTLNIDSQVESLFKNFSYRKPKRGEIGCCLSHLNIWNGVNKDTLILEDDIKFCDGFNDRLALIYRYLKESQPDYDILWLGYHVNKDVKEKSDIDNDNIYLESFQDIMKESGTRDHPFGRHGGGTFGYIVSPGGAKKLKSDLSRGFLFPVDYQMLLSMKNLNMKSFCVVTPLVYSDMYERNGVDTDIQNSDVV